MTNTEKNKARARARRLTLEYVSVLYNKERNGCIDTLASLDAIAARIAQTLVIDSALVKRAISTAYQYYRDWDGSHKRSIVAYAVDIMDNFD